MKPRSGPGPLDQMSLFVPGSGDARPVERAPEPAPEPAALVRSGMWQVHDSYIFAETRAGLVIVDQHSAHERVLYEETLRGFEQQRSTPQRLLFPIVLQLSPAEYSLVEELGALFARTGFEIVASGFPTATVHAVPQPHPEFDAERCLRAVLAELAEGSELVDAARNQHERLALSFACKGAIRAGQRLSPREMGELFDRLFATEEPYRDVHGRPTLVQLSLAELHARFGR